MDELFRAVADEVRPEVRPEVRRPVAIVGAGAIVDVAHLPAYRDAGIAVVGITDLDAGRARDVAERHGIPVVYPSTEALLAAHDAEVVDIAVPGAAQPAIVEAAIAAGYDVLAQKPFAPDVATGRRLADLADAAGRRVVVNQQLRYDEGIAAAHALVRRGAIGDLHHVAFRVEIHTDWAAWPWLLTTPRLEVSNHSIHYHDVVRWMLGEPSAVFCVGRRIPGQRAVAETATTTSYLFDSGATALVHTDHNVTRAEPSATFELQGTRGTIRGTLGLLYDYPHGRADTLELSSDATDGWVQYPVTRRWLPDAFVGPMASLLDALAGGPEPSTSARDNVGTLALVDALYLSQQAATAVDPRSL